MEAADKPPRDECCITDAAKGPLNWGGAQARRPKGPPWADADPCCARQRAGRRVHRRAPTVARLVNALPPAQRRIALHISAREPERRWGVENFIALAQYILHTQEDTQILLFWSPGKADDPHHPGVDEAAATLMKAVDSNRLLPMPTQNLTELIAALSLCDLFIGTDGGAMHLAVALNKQVLALFENLSGKLNHWYPWWVPNRVVCSSSETRPHISQVSKQQVICALAALLNTDT